MDEKKDQSITDINLIEKIIEMQKNLREVLIKEHFAIGASAMITLLIGNAISAKIKKELWFNDLSQAWDGFKNEFEE